MACFKTGCSFWCLFQEHWLAAFLDGVVLDYEYRCVVLEAVGSQLGLTNRQSRCLDRQVRYGANADSGGGDFYGAVSLSWY
jgi:hypothetical protein